MHPFIQHHIYSSIASYTVGGRKQRQCRHFNGCHSWTAFIFRLEFTKLAVLEHSLARCVSSVVRTTAAEMYAYLFSCQIFPSFERCSLAQGPFRVYASPIVELAPLCDPRLSPAHPGALNSSSNEYTDSFRLDG